MSSSIGVFREREINGQPFHIYTLLFQTDDPSSSSSSSSGKVAIDSGGGDLSPQPLFLCPRLRFMAEMSSKRKENGFSEDDVLPCTTSAHFPNTGSVDQLVKSDRYSPICKLPLDLISIDDNYKYSHKTCAICPNPHIGSDVYYFCVTCDKKYHKECVEAPLKIKHPSFPFSSLQLYTCFSLRMCWKCNFCGDWIIGIFYDCPTYNLKLHLVCAMKPIPIFIDHPKRHPHPLTFFPNQNFLPCHVCGLIHASIPTYVCARCVYVVHEDCIYFPSVIRICRHHHRISFTYSLPFGKLFCGVCRRKVDNDYGAYSCNKCDDYFVHSRCAVRKDLWDGEELEGVPEEPEIVVEPFKTIGDGIILHFSHGHNLKLEISRVYDDDQFCQACVLPIYEGSYYSCMDQCDFLLHEACANSPLQKIHPLHAHPLTLKVVTNEYLLGSGSFICAACKRSSCGFVYEDPTNNFKLDLRCASVSEPFQYEGHEHPLFLALTQEEEKSAICRICEDIDRSDIRKLNCMECGYIICFTCATLPYKARYKHDKHFLTLREWKEESDESCWCEVCETKLQISSTRAFYACDDYCCTTLHVDCLLGKDLYMKPGITIHMRHHEARILRNNTLFRPFCQRLMCGGDRCLYRLYFVKKDRTFCSEHCAWYP